MVRPFRASGAGRDWLHPGRSRSSRRFVVGCRACAGVDVPHQDVAVRTQFASPDLIEAIVYRGLDLTEDPQWALSGAVDPDEYAYWAPRCCGMACLQMILLHRDG